MPAHARTASSLATLGLTALAAAVIITAPDPHHPADTGSAVPMLRQHEPAVPASPAEGGLLLRAGLVTLLLTGAAVRLRTRS
jgi:hypothetical protein